MTRLDLPNPCLEILCWLESRPAEPSIALGDGCGVLSDLFKTAPTATKQQWEDWLRILDGQQAILVQLFTSRLLATSFFDPTDGLYSEWESPSRRSGSGYSWQRIVNMGWPGFTYKKALVKGDIRTHLLRTYERVRAGFPSLVAPDDIYRICIPRLLLTNEGRSLLAWHRQSNDTMREARDENGFVKNPLDPTAYCPATRIIQDFPTQVKDLRHLNEILQKNVRIRRWKPRKNRLSVHLGDWRAYVDNLTRSSDGWSSSDSDIEARIEMMSAGKKNPRS